MLVVLIVADSVRADAPGFGGGPACTPLLDLMGMQGATFEDCHCSAAWTVPSLTALTTGTFPHRVGVSRWRHPFPRYRPTLMSAFAAAGFEVRSVVHNPRFCLASTGQRGIVGDSEVPEQVVEALRTPPGADRFVLIHHWWTHLPYVQEKLPKKQWKRSCDLEIEALGHQPEDAVPRLMDAYHEALSWFDKELLDRYLEAAVQGNDDVLVAFTADHGETWGESLPSDHAIEHMYDLHGRWISDETTRVPLMLWGKTAQGPLPAGRRIEGIARGVDLAPTLADLAGVPWPGPSPTCDGKTLVDRGLLVDDPALVTDGISLAGCVRSGRRTPISEALTVTSHNAILPARYPNSGRRMWSRFGLRTDSRRYVWDGLFRVKQVVDYVDEDGGKLARIKDRYVKLPRVWSRLADERRVAVGPGERLPKDLFPRFGVEEEADADLEDQMRMLGYASD